MDKQIYKEFKNKIYHLFLRSLKEYNLLCDGDRVAVCCSGGKDSTIMALCFKELEKYSEVKFTCKYILMDPGYKKEDIEEIKAIFKGLDIQLDIFNNNNFKISNDAKSDPCYMCASMRRGSLYAYAQSAGCNKIALAHHFDDVIETNLMNMLYQGEISTMLPKLSSQNFDSMELIRPMYLVREADIIYISNLLSLKYPDVYCPLKGRCKNSKRQEMKDLICELEQKNKYVPKNIFTSMFNIKHNKLPKEKEQD